MTQIPRRVVGTLTVSQLAERLAPIAPDTEATVQRVRHWTREQLVLPVGSHHGGTGKHRRYAQSAVNDCALLLILTRAGFTVSAIGYLKDALQQTRFALPNWKGGPFYLRATRDGPTDRTETEILWKEPGPPAADFTLVIDLARLFSRIKANPE